LQLVSFSLRNRDLQSSHYPAFLVQNVVPPAHFRGGRLLFFFWCRQVAANKDTRQRRTLPAGRLPCRCATWLQHYQTTGLAAYRTARPAR